MLQVPSTQQEWNTISEGFTKRWHLPGCYGAIDGKHFLITAPSNCGSEYYNYKGANSVVLMAVVDHNYCFQFIDVGSKGSQSDGGIFQLCPLWFALENGLIPDGGFLVGDDAFPLKPYLMKPYTSHRMPLTKEEKVFNYRISRARRIVENAFGILVSRFRVFDRKLSCSLLTVNKLVRAACGLHNWLRMTSSATYLPRGAVDDEHLDSGDVIPGQWRAEIGELRNLEPYGGRRTTELAKKMRDRLKEYVNGVGAVPWQSTRVF